MVTQLPVADVERLVVHEQADDLAVGHVDQRLADLRVAVARLCVGHRMRLVEAVEVRARQAVRLTLLKVRPQTDVSVGEGEDRLPLRQRGEVKLGLADHPRLRREGAGLTHLSSSSSDRSDTTMLAPCSRNASACPARSTPTTQAKPPARPASTPASASSKTAASPGVTPNACAPAKKVSGAGFPFSPSRWASTPSMRASKNPSMPAVTSTSLVLALDETTARRRPALRAASR